MKLFQILQRYHPRDQFSCTKKKLRLRIKQERSWWFSYMPINFAIGANIAPPIVKKVLIELFLTQVNIHFIRVALRNDGGFVCKIFCVGSIDNCTAHIYEQTTVFY